MRSSGGNSRSCARVGYRSVPMKIFYIIRNPMIEFQGNLNFLIFIQFFYKFFYFSFTFL